MTAGIISMHKVPNFGSHLQAYALQSALENLGVKTELIDYRYPNDFHLERLKELNNKTPLLRKIFQILFFPRSLWRKCNLYRQRIFYKNFEKEYFHLSKEYLSQEELKNADISYDIYITGSDQVWNPRFMAGDSIFMCDFGKDDVPRISYGASVAASKIPVELETVYSSYIGKYTAIGIREKSSKKSLEKFINKDIKVVCDPVFLISDDEWTRIARKSKIKLPKKYILVYILTYSFNPYPETLEIINKIKKKYNLPVVFLDQGLKLFFKVKQYKSIFAHSTEDFLNLIKNASFVITTSFHVTAFSLIFNRQFFSVVDDNEQRDSRIKDLLEVIGAGEAYCKKKDIANLKEYEIDYSVINKNMTEYINQSMGFLSESIKATL